MITTRRLHVMIILSFLLSFFYVPQLLSAENAGIVTKTVAYDQDREKRSGFMARPMDNHKHPALILIHEWWGLNENIKENARRFAKAGFMALAVDLYAGCVAITGDEARALAGGVRGNMPQALDNLKQAVKLLKAQSGYVLPERIASVGWCFGGGWSYQMAKNNLGVKASVIYYGRFNPKDDLTKMRVTILGHFGESDRGIRVDTVREFQAKLKTLNGEHEIFIFPNAGHAFANSSGKNYDPAAAELAWQRTLEFLNKYLLVKIEMGGSWRSRLVYRERIKS